MLQVNTLCCLANLQQITVCSFPHLNLTFNLQADISSNTPHTLKSVIQTRQSSALGGSDLNVSGKSVWNSMRSTIRCCIALAACISLSQNATAEPILLAGSGSNLPATRLLVKAFNRLHPEIPFKTPINIGSAGAIRARA